ncbi:MAG: HeH/LEM domain-containing protein [Planctomycetota bacterium]
MNTIHVIPADGFQVRDHKGQVIPEQGGQVEDSPVVQRRIREGLLVVAPDRANEVAPRSVEHDVVAPQPAPDPAPKQLPPGDEDEGDEEPFDISELKVPELRQNLTDRGVDFDPAARKPELVELLTQALVAESEADSDDDLEG